MPTSTMNVDSVGSTTSVMGMEVRDNLGTSGKMDPQLDELEIY